MHLVNMASVSDPGHQVNLIQVTESVETKALVRQKCVWMKETQSKLCLIPVDVWGRVLTVN